MSKPRSLHFLRPALFRSLLALIVCWTYLPQQTSAQTPPDLTSSARLLGNPVSQFYSRTGDKSSARDLQVFGDRLYIGHGSTSSTQYTRILYYDLTTRSFGQEKNASGTTLIIKNELIRNMRVQDGELLLEDYDPFSRVRFYRKSASGEWTINDVGPDAHARDLFKFGNEYFVNHGHGDTSYPYVYYSPDKGATWQPVKQTSLFNGFGVPYDEFFEFGGKLYLSGGAYGLDLSTGYLGPTKQPFMLRYEGGGRFAVAYQKRADFLSGPSYDDEYVSMAHKIGRKLVFKWGYSSVYLASSIEPLVAEKVTLPAFEVKDIVLHEGFAYVLMIESRSSKSISHVYRVSESGDVRGVFSVTLPSAAAAVEFHGTSAYLSINGVQLYEVPNVVSASAPPPPAPAPVTDMTIDVKVLLQGPFDANTRAMRSTIKPYLNIREAFNGLPTKHYGDALVWDVATAALDLDIVDFVLLELRSSTAASSRVYRRGALLMADGSVRGFDGTSLPVIRNVAPGSYYVVIRHRNHLDVMSATKVDLSSGTAKYDFTTAANKAYGSGAQVLLATGLYGLYTGDMNASGLVDTPDVFTVWSPQNGLAGYRGGDVDLSGFVNALDLLQRWLPNVGRKSNVPD